MKSEKQINLEVDRTIKLMDEFSKKKDFTAAGNNKIWYAALNWVLDE